MPALTAMMRKPIIMLQEESQNGELKRSLSATHLISLGIGCIIGTGIFVMTGQAAALYAGPAISISFFLTAICCAFCAMCYAELAAMLPVSGSAYSYAYASLGEAAAWMMGWLLLLEYSISGSTVAVGWSGYLVSFLQDFGIIVPPEWAWATGTHLIHIPEDGWKEISEAVLKEAAGKGAIVSTLATKTAPFNLPASISLLIVTLLLMAGVKKSVTVNNVIVAIKLGVIFLFIGIGIFYIHPENWHPFIPENTGEFGHFGWSGILRGTGYIFFAYVGFESVSTAAQEAKNPERDVPIGILGSLIICTLLYMVVSLVLTGLVKYDVLNVPDPMAVAVSALHMPWLAFVIKLGALCGLSSVMLVLIYGQTRIFYTMAKDGLLPGIFSHVHSKAQTPWLNTLLVGIISSIIAGVTPIEKLGNLVNLGTLLAFTIICFTVLYMRIKEPGLHRPYNVPLPRITPLFGMISCGILISTLWETFLALIPYITLGIVIYVTYGHRHSKLRHAPETF